MKCPDMTHMNGKGLIMAFPKITFLPIQEGSHRTHAAGVARRQEHSLRWTANPSFLGLA